jgi:glycosyltransferase involved in cell wall biosynthesis
MRDPTISVVIPTYNRARFLPAAVASVRAQSYPCNEVLIVDDGSTDDTTEVVAGLGPEVRLIRQANAGPAAARNRGIHEAGGDLVAFLDTDDRWLPGKLAAQVELFRREPALGLVCADMAIENAAGVRLVDSNFVQRGLQQGFAALNGRPVPDAPRRLLELNFVNTSTVVARRQLLTDLGGFDTRLRYGEDLELWLRIAARHPIACVASVQEVRVEHDSNVTRSVEPMLLGYVKMAEAIREWAGAEMTRWGMDADRYVANCTADLGYWYFSNDRMSDARKAMAASFRQAPNMRSLVYLAGSLLPGPLRRFVRRIKARAGG